MRQRHYFVKKTTMGEITCYEDSGNGLMGPESKQVTLDFPFFEATRCVEVRDCKTGKINSIPKTIHILGTEHTLRYEMLPSTITRHISEQPIGLFEPKEVAKEERLAIYYKHNLLKENSDDKECEWLNKLSPKARENFIKLAKRVFNYAGVAEIDHESMIKKINPDLAYCIAYMGHLNRSLDAEIASKLEDRYGLETPDDTFPYQAPHDLGDLEEFLTTDSLTHSLLISGYGFETPHRFNVSTAVRTLHWLDDIITLSAKSDKPIFLAVGAGHVSLILTLLEKYDFKISRLIEDEMVPYKRQDYFFRIGQRYRHYSSMLELKKTITDYKNPKRNLKKEDDVLATRTPSSMEEELLSNIRDTVIKADIRITRELNLCFLNRQANKNSMPISLIINDYLGLFSRQKFSEVVSTETLRHIEVELTDNEVEPFKVTYKPEGGARLPTIRWDR